MNQQERQKETISLCSPLLCLAFGVVFSAAKAQGKVF
jgi:hypothetical protein